MKTHTRLVLAALCAILVGASGAAFGHALAPSLVRLTSEGDGLAVVIRSPRAGPPPVLRPTCEVEPGPTVEDGEHRVTSARWRCPGDAVLRLMAEPGTPPVLVERLSSTGDASLAVLDAAHPEISLAGPPSWTRWLTLGAEHLWLGLDHVLVVVALCALLGLRRRLVWALTAFTLGHSISLALAATGVLTLPSALVEVAIAVTLVLLGLELAAPQARPGLAVRHPMTSGLAVGLVHGLGFAGVLAELMGGAPSGLAPALLGFNLGLELGQLALVLGVFVFVRLFLVLREVRFSSLSIFETMTPRLAGWVVGVAGSAWVFERALS